MTWKKTLLMILILTSCTEKIEIRPNDIPLIMPPEILELNETNVTFTTSFDNIDLSSVEDHGFVLTERRTSIDDQIPPAIVVNLGSINSFEFSAQIVAMILENQRYRARAFVDTSDGRIWSISTDFVRQ